MRTTRSGPDDVHAHRHPYDRVPTANPAPRHEPWTAASVGTLWVFTIYMSIRKTNNFGRERARHFGAEHSVCIRTAANRDVHLRKVVSDDGREARLRCLSAERAAKERAIVERFVERFERALTELSEGPAKPPPGNGPTGSGNASGGSPGTTTSPSAPTQPDNTPPPSASPDDRCGGDDDPSGPKAIRSSPSSPIGSRR